MKIADVITLLPSGYAPDAIGQMIPSTQGRDVMCEMESVSASEFFAGGQIGLKPEWRATVFAGDYNGENAAVYKGEYYSIYRTYRADLDRVELYMEKRHGRT